MTTKTPSAVPDGYKLDSQERLVPVALIREIDLMRDELVLRMFALARLQAEELAKLKELMFSEIAAFISLSADQYDVTIGGKKGNVTLMSYDGRYKIQRAIQESLVFDERLQAAKALIDACLQRWSQGSQPEIKMLINDAFQVDKEGNINTGRVLGLRRLAITDPEWLQAMTAIGESLQVAGSRSYVRLYERVGDSDKYVPLSLDLAGA